MCVCVNVYLGLFCCVFLGIRAGLAIFGPAYNYVWMGVIITNEG